MTPERTLELIRQRHSVRKYLPKPIAAETLAALEAEIARINAQANLHIVLIADGGAFKGAALRMIGWKNAQACIALAGPAGEDLEEKVGYWGEELVLLCQDLGLNTCWAGMAKKRNVPIELAEGEEYVLGIGVGYGENPGVTRKSKSFADVTELPAGMTQDSAPAWFRDGVESALLAPTAINQQKFTITLNADESVSFAAQSGPFSMVDLGIVKYHFEVASGKKVF